VFSLHRVLERTRNGESSAYLAGPHLQQWQRAGGLVVAGGPNRRRPRSGRSGSARRGRGARSLREAGVVQVVKALGIAAAAGTGRLGPRWTLIAGGVLRGRRLGGAPESLQAQLAPFFLFLQSATRID